MRATPADAFVDSIGVNIQLHYNDTIYGDFAKVRNALGEDGKAGLMIPDEDAEGSSAQLVILDAAGQVLTKRPVMIGEN